MPLRSLNHFSFKSGKNLILTKLMMFFTPDILYVNPIYAFGKKELTKYAI